MNVSEMYKQFLADLPAKTGRTIENWRTEIRANGPAKYPERIIWLRAKHGLDYRDACMLAQQASDTPAEYADPAALIEKMYAGARAGLRPVFERLLEIGLGLGPDVTESTGKTMVSLRRKHVFAQIKPTTKARVDLGFAFPRNVAHHSRLIETGGLEKGDRISHRIEIRAVEEIDAEVTALLQAAYDGDAAV